MRSRAKKKSSAIEQSQRNEKKLLIKQLFDEQDRLEVLFGDITSDIK